MRSFAGRTITDSLAASASVKPAVAAAWEINTSLLVTVAVSAIAFGLLAVNGAWLAGRTGPAVALRRAAAPYSHDQRLPPKGVAAAVCLALVAWTPIAAFRKPFGVLLFATGTELPRGPLTKEFPDAKRGLADQLSALMVNSYS